MSRFFPGLAVAVLPLLCVGSVLADEQPTYTLRYKFQPGETIRWEVEHRSDVRTKVSGETVNAEMATESVKVWRITEVKPDGAATFEHSVERVNMWNKRTGCDEVRYNSETDKTPPPGFETVAKSVGVPLSAITMDTHGKVLHRERKGGNGQEPATNDNQAATEGWMTIPLPEEAVPVGHVWTLPMDIDIPLERGGVKRIKAIQRFTLEDVKTGVATVRVVTEILSPVSDPAIEAKLVQRESSGRVRFDIDAGRVLSQQMDVDKHVVGFRGETSSIHYVNRFSERLRSDIARTAAR